MCEQLQKTRGNINNRVININNQVSNINNKVSNINNQVSNINNKVSNINNKVSNVNNKVSNKQELDPSTNLITNNIDYSQIQRVNNQNKKY